MFPAANLLFQVRASWSSSEAELIGAVRVALSQQQSALNGWNGAAALGRVAGGAVRRRKGHPPSTPRFASGTIERILILPRLPIIFGVGNWV
jgi:hypothetical protein